MGSENSKMSVDWRKIRDEFKIAKNHTYLMAAAAGPLHPWAHQRLKEFLNSSGEHGDVDWDKNIEEIERIRSQVASFIHADPKEIAFLSSTSLAMNVFSLILKKKLPENRRRVLSMESEFPSSTLPWKFHGFQVDFCKTEGGDYPEEKIKLSLNDQTSVILSSQIQYGTGYQQDVRMLSRLARDNNSFLAINATQAFGAQPVNSQGVDFMSASIHKWLMAGYGLCITKISSNFLKSLPLYGWLSQKDIWALDNNAIDPLNEAKALEVGCGPMTQLFSVGAVLSWIESIGGISVISKRLLDLAEWARERLAKAEIPLVYSFDREHSSSLLFLKCVDPQKMETELAKRNIFVNKRGPAIRVSLHVYNDESDIEALVRAWNQIC